MNTGRVLSTALIALAGGLIGAGLTYVLIKPHVPPPAAPQPQPPRAEISYRAVAFADLPGWGEDALMDAVPAIKRSCANAARTSSDAPTQLGGQDIPAAARVAACMSVLAAADNAQDLRRAIENSFRPYAVSLGDNALGTFTGYYEATLRGALQRGGPYQTPLYGPPRDLISVSLKDFVAAARLDGAGLPPNIVGRLVERQLKPYYTREQIDAAQAIADESDVVAWVDDPVDAHVLHIQGSGQITLPDGAMMRVGFAGHNGHAFKGLGRILIDEGVLKPGDSSMGAVRDWLKKNPKRAADLMNRNARYIFFKRIEGDGPIGAEGVALTPGRSLAVDPRSVPLGLPVWLDTADPDGAPLRRLVMAQDVGAAITGAVRGDFFWGSGEAAFAKAARMKSRGAYYVLVPRDPNEGKD